MSPETPFDRQLWNEIVNKRSIRLKLATESLYYFAHIYFGEFIRYKTAPFQHEIYKLLADENENYVAVVAFRGSGKSTIATQIFPIWALLGQLNKKYILILSLNQSQAQNHLQNIKRQIEGNEMLLKDFGPLNEESTEWGAMSLVFPNYNARISAASMGQSIRGTRHGPYRPDLIIADDIEDTETTRTKEGRNKIYNWYKSEVLPTGDIGTKIVLVGNLLHEDSLMMRVKEGLVNGESDGVFKMYPLIGSNGKTLWPGKYPNQASIEHEYRKLNDRITWHREYLLKILPTDEQVIRPEWIKYYDMLPSFDSSDRLTRHYHTFLAVDLAVSQRDSADKTAMVTIHVFGRQENLRVYVDPIIINKRMTHMQTIESIEKTVERLGGKAKVEVVIEATAYQESVVQVLESKNYRVEGVKPYGADKRGRFVVTSHLFEYGRVYIPKRNGKELVEQILGFGVERYDDLVDALVMCLQKVISTDKAPTGGTIITGGRSLFADFWESERGRRRITRNMKF